MLFDIGKQDKHLFKQFYIIGKTYCSSTKSVPKQPWNSISAFVNLAMGVTGEEQPHMTAKLAEQYYRKCFKGTRYDFIAQRKQERAAGCAVPLAKH